MQEFALRQKLTQIILSALFNLSELKQAKNIAGNQHKNLVS